MLDIRLHIFSLVAVFLALGLGILIGLTLDGSDLFLREQQQLIKALEEDFERLREDRKTLQAEVAGLRSEIRARENRERYLMELLTAGRLQDMRVAFVGSEDAYEEIRRGLENSGARLELAGDGALEEYQAVIVDLDSVGVLEGFEGIPGRVVYLSAEEPDHPLQNLIVGPKGPLRLLAIVDLLQREEALSYDLIELWGTGPE